MRTKNHQIFCFPLSKLHNSVMEGKSLVTSFPCSLFLIKKGREVSSNFLPYFPFPENQLSEMEVEVSSNFLPLFPFEMEVGTEVASDFPNFRYSEMEVWKEVTSNFLFRKWKSYLSKEITLPFPSREIGEAKPPRPYQIAYADMGKPIPRKETFIINSIIIIPEYHYNCGVLN